MMQGLNWEALPVVAAYIGVEDIALVIRGLLQIREYQDKLEEARRAHGK